RFDLRPGEDAVFTARDSRHAAGNRRHGCEFVEVDMAALLADDFVAVMGPDFDCDEVAHAASRNKKRRFFAEDFGGTAFEGVDRRVFEVNVVADLGFSHGPAHGRGWTGYGIAA